MAHVGQEFVLHAAGAQERSVGQLQFGIGGLQLSRPSPDALLQLYIHLPQAGLGGFQGAALKDQFLILRCQLLILGHQLFLLRSDEGFRLFAVGDVLLSVDGPVTARSDFGDVGLKQVAATSYDLHSSSGAVKVDGAGGAVKADSGFGAVEVVNGDKVTLDLRTNSGDISLEILKP
jgi:hypothetical protein